jgi:hypothetical protein
MFVRLLVEGDLDETVAMAVVTHAGGTVTHVFPKRGFGYIRKLLPDVNDAAKGQPILAMVDLMDTGFDCPVAARDAWLPNPEPRMLFRLVVREIESWLMADRTGLARFLGVEKDQVPRRPEEEEDPKRSLIRLAKKSPRSRLRRRLVPERSSTATEGPLYTPTLRRFVRDQWSIQRATPNAESLARCVRALERLIANQTP